MHNETVQWAEEEGFELGTEEELKAWSELGERIIILTIVYWIHLEAGEMREGRL